MYYYYKLAINFGIILIFISILLILAIIKSDKIKQVPDLPFINFKYNDNTSNEIHNSLNTNKSDILEKEKTKQYNINRHEDGTKNRDIDYQANKEPDKITSIMNDINPYFEYDKLTSGDYDQISKDSFEESTLIPDLNKFGQIEKPSKNISFKLFSIDNVIGSASMGVQFEDYDKIDTVDLTYDKNCTVALSRYLCFDF